MRRGWEAWGLTAGLIAIALLAWLPATRRIAGGAGYRQLIFWGLPVAAGLAAGVARGMAAGRAARVAPTLSPLHLIPLLGFAFLIDHSFLAVGHLTGWVTFTYGDQTLSAAPLRAALWALPASLLLGVFGWERALRGGILAGWAAHFPARTAGRGGAAGPRGGAGNGRAAAVSCAVGTLLVAPSFAQGPPFPDLPYLLAALFTALCRETAYSVLFLAGGGSMGGLYRGWLYYFEGLVISDWYGLFFPAANYASSEPRFYLIRALTAALSAASLAGGALWLGRRSRAERGRSGL